MPTGKTSEVHETSEVWGVVAGDSIRPLDSQHRIPLGRRREKAMQKLKSRPYESEPWLRHLLAESRRWT